MQPHEKTADSNAPEKTATREWLILAGIVLLGLLMRGAYLRVLVKEPSFSIPIGDMKVHDYWARALATGDWTAPEGLPEVHLPGIPFLRPPGYPYFLGLTYWAFGTNYLGPRIVQMGLGLVSAVLAFLLGRSLFGGLCGLILAALMSSYWAFIYFEGELHYPALVIFLTLGLINVLRLWTVKLTYLRAVGAGVILGICALTSPSMLLLAPVILVWGLWVAWRRTQLKRYILIGLVFTVATSLAVAPATIRNYMAADDFVVISCSYGLAIYCANNEIADVVNARIPGLEKLAGRVSWGWLTYPLIVRGVQREQGRDMKYSEVSAYFTGKAVKFMRGHPKRFMGLIATKAALFWGPVEVTDNKVVHYDRQKSAVLRYCPGFSVFLALCIIGGGFAFFDVRAAGKRKDTGQAEAKKQLEVCVLIFLFVATYFLSFLPVMASARYRVPIIPFVLLFSAYAIYRMGQLIRSRDWRKLAGCGFVALALYLQLSKPVSAYAPSRGKWHVGRAIAYQRTGEVDQAIAEYREAVRLEPSISVAHMHLANLLAKQGKWKEAITPARKMVEISPDSAIAYLVLGQLLAEADISRDEGISHLTKAVELAPESFHAHLGLATAWSRDRKFDQAAVHFERARQLEPENPKLYSTLAKSLAAQGRTEEAINAVREVLRLKPADAEARRLLSILINRQGMKE